MINEFDFDDSVLAVDGESFDIRLSLTILQEHVDHFVLEGLFHVLDDEFLALFNLLLDCLFRSLVCAHLLKLL